MSLRRVSRRYVTNRSNSENEQFGVCADRDNKRRSVPSAADVGRHDGEVDRRLHHTSSLSLAARALLHSIPRLGTYCLRRASRAVSCRQPLIYDKLQEIDIVAECRHDMRSSVQLPSVSGADSKLGLTMGYVYVNNNKFYLPERNI